MLKGLFAVGSYYTEGLNIGSVNSYIGNDTDYGNKCFAHYLSSFKAFITFTIFIDIGHLLKHLPQPTQLNIPSLFAG